MVSAPQYFFDFFANRLRLSKPWRFKIPVLITIFYLVLIIGDKNCYSPLVSFLSSLFIVIGVSGIGYLTNDLGDIEKDRLISKPNAATQLNNFEVGFIFIFFLALAILPWQYLPFNYKSVCLLCFEFLLFFMYAFKPFRLKEKGFLGVVTDALYAHTVPALLAAYTYFMVVETPKNSFWWFILLLCPWQFFLGLRNILLHQMADNENDLQSATKTFVTEKGLYKAKKLSRYFLFAEMLFFMALITFLSRYAMLFFIGPVIYWIVMLYRKRESLRNLSLKETMYLFFDELYLDWLPVFALLFILDWQPFSFIVIPLLHAFLFRSRIKHCITNSSLYRRAKYRFDIFFQSESPFGYYLLKQILVFGIYLCGFIACYFVFSFSSDEQLYLSRLLVCIFLFHVILVIYFKYETIKGIISNFIYEKGSAVNLGIFRIIMFLILSGHFLNMPDTQTSWSFLPDEQRVELPYMNWLLSALPVSPQLFKFSCYSAGILSVFVTIGLFARWASVALIPFAFYAIGVPMFYGKISHYHALLWVPLIMCFSPLSDALSIDRLLKGRTSGKRPTESLSYAIPFKFIWIMLAIIYFFAGVHKLWESGLEWALGDSMIDQIRWEWVENYDKVPAFRIDHYPVLAKVGGVLVIVFECLYPLLIFHRRARLMAVLGAFILHISIGYFMNIDFVYLRYISLTYIDWNGMFGYFKKKLNDTSFESVNFTTYTLTRRERIGIFVCSTLVILNFLCSTFRIHTYPFSSYPTYSALAKPKIDILVMEPVDSDVNYKKMMQLAKSTNFRWENLRRLEQDIADRYLQSDTINLNNELNNYWRIWRSNFDELKQIKKVKFYIKSYSIEPEKRNLPLDSIYLKEVLIQP